MDWHEIFKKMETIKTIEDCRDMFIEIFEIREECETKLEEQEVRIKGLVTQQI